MLTTLAYISLVLNAQVLIYFSTLNSIADFTLLCCQTFPCGKEGCNCGGGVLPCHYLTFDSILFWQLQYCFLKLATWMQLNKSYMDICKSSLIPPVGSLELSNICRVLNDQVTLHLLFKYIPCNVGLQRSMSLLEF